MGKREEDVAVKIDLRGDQEREITVEDGGSGADGKDRQGSGRF